MIDTETLPRCNACGQPVTSATTTFPMTEDGERHLVERMHPCGCVVVDVPLAPVYTGAIGPDEDINALAEAWHRLAAAAERLGPDDDPADGLARLLGDALAVAGIPINGVVSSERVATIRHHVERHTP